jgi:hypothetical protein
MLRHRGIKMSHRLAVVDNFKGIHDAVGKDPAHLVRGLELMGIRSANAYQVFINCSRCLQRTEDETKWKEYVRNRDYRLVQKGRFGINTRTCWFVVETQEDFDRLSVLHPNRVLLVDRSYIQDTQGEKAIDGTTLLHEVTSWAEEEPTTMPRVWPAFVANLPCNCDYNPTNTQCPFSPWRKARIIHVTEGLKEGEVAVHTPFAGVRKDDLKKLCKDNNLLVGGNMAQLIARLIAADVQQ